MVEPAPLKNMLVKMGKSSPNFGGWKIKDIFETRKQFIMAPYNLSQCRDLCRELHWKIRFLANESFPVSSNERLRYASGRNILKG